MSNVEKTEEKIKQYLSEFHNVFLYLQRGSWKYEVEGRIHTEEESIQISCELKDLLNELNVSYKSFESSQNEIKNMIDYIIDSV